MFYKYGMRLRGFSLGCQPMGGLVERQDDPRSFHETKRKYHDILVYDRMLTDEETIGYDLDFLKAVTDKNESCF